MNSFSIVTEARQNYSVLHQSTEMNDCLEMLMETPLNGFIEVGSANGGSFHCWGRAIPDGPKISVDWNFGFGLVNQTEGDTVAKESDYLVIQERNNKWRSFFTDVITIDGDSRAVQTVDAVEKALNGRMVDWVFIDAWHEYDAAISDYQNYSKFLSPTGRIGFHDIYQSESMIKFWNEMKDKHETIEFSGGTGLGVITKLR